MNNTAEYPVVGSEVVTKDNPRIVALIESIDRMAERMELLTQNCKPLLNGEHYLTDRQASERLHISRRTLQDYRNQGKIPYFQIGGKILYRASDLQRMLDYTYREAYR